MAVEKKISELTAKSTELQPLDKLEVSEWNGATFDTKSISGSGFILHKKVSITAAELLTANSSPINLIDAAGAGTALEVLSVLVKFNYGTVAFDGASGTVNFNVDTATDDYFEYADLLSQTADSLGFAFGNSNPEKTVENQEFHLIANNDSTVGDSTLDVYINYRIITL